VNTVDMNMNNTVCSDTVTYRAYDGDNVLAPWQHYKLENSKHDVCHAP